MGFQKDFIDKKHGICRSECCSYVLSAYRDPYIFLVAKSMIDLFFVRKNVIVCMIQDL